MGHGDSLTKALSGHNIFDIEIMGISIVIDNSILVIWIIMAFLVIASIVMTKTLALVPATAKQHIAELVVDGVNNFTKGFTGHHWPHIAPFIGTLFLFLGMSNLISIFNFIPFIEITPPAKNINVALALAVLSIFFVIYYNIRFKKVSGFLRSFVEPVPLAAPLKIMEYFIRGLSLAVRLFGNILAAYIIMDLIYEMMPVFLPAGLSIYFDIFDGILQAFIFVFLTCLYIGEAVE